MSLPDLQAKLHHAVLEGEEAEGVGCAQDALQGGLSPLDYFQQVISPVVTDVGERFARLEIFLPELMRAGMVVKAIQAQVLDPAIKKEGLSGGSEGRVVIGTSQGDIHDIGKNMVALMLQVSGFIVADLGTNVTAKDFIEAAKREGADIIATSTLLTSSLPFTRDLIELLKGYGLRQRFSVIAGGAAVTQQWVDKCGLDGFGRDAIEAVDLCRHVIQMRKGKGAI